MGAGVYPSLVKYYHGNYPPAPLPQTDLENISFYFIFCNNPRYLISCNEFLQWETVFTTPSPKILPRKAPTCGKYLKIFTGYLWEKEKGVGAGCPLIIFNSKIKELEISISNKVNTLQS